MSSEQWGSTSANTIWNTRLFHLVQRVRDYRLWMLRNDLLAGVTVSLVLIPQSVISAQLAGLPPYYGLHAVFLPPLVAALFGSSL